MDWISEAQKNGGILPDTFIDDPDTDNTGLFADLWYNTHKFENFTKFSKETITEVLSLDPLLMISLVKSELFDKEYLTSIQTRATLEYAPDEIVLDVISKEPQNIAFVSDDFIDNEYTSILPYLHEDPELLANPFIPNNLKEKPEVSAMLKDILMERIPVSQESLDKMRDFSSLPRKLREDEELFRFSLKKNYNFYDCAGKNIRNNLELTLLAIADNPEKISDVGEELLQNNTYINSLYFMQNPTKFATHKFAPKDTTDITLLEKVLRTDFSNYKLFEGRALETPAAKNVEFGLQQLEQAQKGAKDNPNLTYDLVSNREIMQLPPEALKSFLEYDSKSVQSIIEISQKGDLDNFKKFLDWTFKNSGKNQRSAYNAITNYQFVADVVHDVDLNNLSFSEKKSLEHIIATKNPYNIKTKQELNNYPERIKNECLQETTLEGMKKKIFQTFGYTSDELTQLKETFPQLASHFSTIKFLDSVSSSTDITSLKEQISKSDFNKILRAPTSLYSKFSQAYEAEYRDTCLKLSTLETTSVQEGVEIKDLGKKPFKMFMHRIFNFDPNLSEYVTALMEHPEKWETLTGATYISTSFITDKSIKGVFRTLKSGTDLEYRGKETMETLQKEVDNVKKARAKPKEIDSTAVFLGFSEIPEGSLIGMAPRDMMTEHGGKHAKVKSDYCKFYSPDDLAYSTVGGWNEAVIRRENPATGKRIMPTCIICFDKHINPESIHFAKTMHLPIINISRDNYAALNQEEQKQSQHEFEKNLSISSLRKLFYSTPMTDMVDFKAEEILNIINTHPTAPAKKRLKALSFMQEQFNRLINEEDLISGRYYCEIKLAKLTGTYVSDKEKIDKIHADIEQSQKHFQTMSPQKENSTAKNSGFLKSAQEKISYLRHNLHPQPPKSENSTNNPSQTKANHRTTFANNTPREV